MEIIKEKEWLERFPMISQFQEAYRNFPGIMAFTALAEGGETADPDRTALLLLRLFIETGKRAKKGQKYVIGLRFYSFGDMATADLISLDLLYHWKIAFGHAKRLGWEMSVDDELRDTYVYVEDKFRDTYIMPFLFSGGYLEITASDEIIFSGESSDYGGEMLGLDINEIARILAHLCGVSVQGDTVKGEAFFGGILEFMRKNKLKSNFYEFFLEHNIKFIRTGQHLSSLVMMKAIDRATKEGENFLQVLIQEVFGEGLAKLMLRNQIRKARNSEQK